MEEKGKKKDVKTKENLETTKVIEFVRKNQKKLNKCYNEIKKSKSEAIDTHIYEEICEDDFCVLSLKTSIVILTANFFEREILNYNIHITNNQKIKKIKNGINIFGNDFRITNAYIFSINDYTILHLSAPETGSNTPCGSSDLVRYITNNKFINPSCIISFGICYGINCEKQHLGNTIFAQKIYPWSIGQKVTESGWSIKHDDYILDLRQTNSQLYNNIKDICEGLTNNTSDIIFENNVEIGNINTGEAVVNNASFRRDIIAMAHGFDIIGGEMEGYGLAKECIYYSKIPCVILKAICDWGVSKNVDDEINKVLNTNGIDYKGRIQAYASYCAFTVLKKLFFECVFENTSTFNKLICEKLYQYKRDGYIDKNTLKKLISDYLNICIKDPVLEKIIIFLEDNNIICKLPMKNAIGYCFKD